MFVWKLNASVDGRMLSESSNVGKFPGSVVSQGIFGRSSVFQQPDGKIKVLDG